MNPALPGADAATPASFPGPRLLKVKEAATYLNTSAWNIRNLLRHRELPKIKIDGKKFRVDRADLDAFVERMKREAA